MSNTDATSEYTPIAEDWLKFYGRLIGGVGTDGPRRVQYRRAAPARSGIDGGGGCVSCGSSPALPDENVYNLMSSIAR